MRMRVHCEPRRSGADLMRSLRYVPELKRVRREGTSALALTLLVEDPSRYTEIREFFEVQASVDRVEEFDTVDETR